tara:strand:- start:372 stop:1247 length:876 start_codon:yes stop_codon:yes gene_type:complete
MHVPGHNPYITTGAQGGQANINAIINYLTGQYGQSQDDFMGGEGFSEGTYNYGFDVNLPTYQYQGLNQEIMGALGNVFTPTGAGNFDPQNFGQDMIQSQIEQQFGDISVEDWGNIIGDDIFTFDDATGYGQLFYPSEGPVTLGDIGDFDYDTSSIENALAFTDVFDPESLANTLSQMAGVDHTDPLAAIRAGEVKALTPEMIERTEGQYYEPLEQAKRADLVEDKVRQLSKTSTGGFAGSAGRQAGLSGAERLYKGGYEDLIAQIEGMKGQATEDVLDTVYGWQELMTGLK